MGPCRCSQRHSPLSKPEPPYGSPSPLREPPPKTQERKNDQQREVIGNLKRTVSVDDDNLFYLVDRHPRQWLRLYFLQVRRDEIGLRIVVQALHNISIRFMLLQKPPPFFGDVASGRLECVPRHPTDNIQRQDALVALRVVKEGVGSLDHQQVGWYT